MLNMNWTEEAEQLLSDGEDRARVGRRERLRTLLSVEDKEAAPMPGLAYE